MKKNLELTTINFWLITLNSTAAYIIAYLLIFYTNHFIKIALAGNFGYDVGFDHSQIFYYIEPHEWTHDAVQLIYSVGPIMILILGGLALIAFWYYVQEQARVKILFIWISLHAFNFLFGSLMIGNIFKEGVGHVFNWMYLTDTTKMIVALFGFVGLLGTAFTMSKPVALSANSYFNQLSERNFPFFITSQLLLPFIFGTLIYLAYFLPNILFQESYSWITMAFILVFITLRVSKMDTQYFDEEDRFIGASALMIIITILLVVSLRGLMWNETLINW